MGVIPAVTRVSRRISPTQVAIRARGTSAHSERSSDERSEIGNDRTALMATHVERPIIIGYKFSMLRFIREHIFSSLFLVLGAILTLGSRINDAYTIINAGLPAGVWEAIGLGTFMAQYSSS